MGRVEGKVVLVTGAASGIGQATVQLMAAEGAAVLAADVNPAGEAVAAAVRAAGGQARFVAGDVTRSVDAQRMVAAAVELGGGLDGVVNNAAVGIFDRTVETCSEAEWDRVIAINLKSIFLVSKYAIPHLRARGGGVIVNISSPHAFATTPGVAPYAAAKGGVVALSRQMAMDFARDNIRVISVVPGAVDTPMLRSHADRQNTTLEALGFHADPRMIGRIAQPVELARVLLFLVSDEASFIQGAPIIADGGLLARL